MIDRTSARSAALAYINANLGVSEELDIVDEGPAETAHAWVFFYNTKRYLETGEFSYRLAGNGPVLVNKTSGEIVTLGTAPTVPELLEEYEGRFSS